MVTLAALFLTVSHTFNLPPGLLSSICYVESHHNPKAMHLDDGGANSVGACQVQLGTARVLGFKGSEEALRRPQVNVYFAGLYLRKQLDRYDGDISKSVAAYNAGKWRVNKDGLTMNRKYVQKVYVAWKEKR